MILSVIKIPNTKRYIIWFLSMISLTEDGTGYFGVFMESRLNIHVAAMYHIMLKLLKKTLTNFFQRIEKMYTWIIDSNSHEFTR